MIEKIELLSILREAMISEEKLIPILNRHLSSAVVWTGVDKEKTEGAQRVLKQLAMESEGHRKINEKLINKIEKEDRDAF